MTLKIKIKGLYFKAFVDSSLKVKDFEKKTIIDPLKYGIMRAVLFL